MFVLQVLLVQLVLRVKQVDVGSGGVGASLLLLLLQARRGEEKLLLLQLGGVRQGIGSREQARVARHLPLMPLLLLIDVQLSEMGRQCAGGC